ncbi:UbiA family prenyltransferase [Anaerobiospirillum sp. NML120449]|uniref:UbiA family prenyltransferase n=1 Tax=Anaerobiospirillum sp. NML120449 TaxID=2932817 RepID=UPI001FF364D9|nr:UbiA family prenyltransferase [Anaerobiospirillum sp. NML120449]MCK0525984.1 UbiA family prenyltransferase [Anaerobiospirillum sp. NML120449]
MTNPESQYRTCHEDCSSEICPSSTPASASENSKEFDKYAVLGGGGKRPPHLKNSCLLCDFDGTVTTRDSFFPFILTLFLVSPSWVIALKSLALLSMGFLRLKDAASCKARLLALYLEGLSSVQIEQRSSLFLALIFNRMLSSISSAESEYAAELQSRPEVSRALAAIKARCFEYHRHHLSLIPKDISFKDSESFVRTHVVLRMLMPEFRPFFLYKAAKASAAGSISAIVSASPDIYLAPIAKAMGMELICTTCRFDGGYFAGYFSSENCNGRVKKAMIIARWPELKPADHVSADKAAPESNADTDDDEADSVSACRCAPEHGSTACTVSVYGNSRADYAMLELASSHAHAHLNDFVKHGISSSISSWISLLRVHQYLKNTFVFIPLFFAGQFFDSEALVDTVWVFAAFCLCASLIYVLNDLKDAARDRLHSHKRYRAIASGRVSRSAALVGALVLAAGAAAISMMLNQLTALLCLCYVALNLVYIYKAKNIALIDIIFVALGFNLRVFAGAAAIEIQVSEWLVLMVFLLSMFLVTGKRWDDLGRPDSTRLRASMYGYNKEFALSTLTFLSAVNTVCYILYSMDGDVTARIGSEYLYITALWVVMGNLRYLQNIFVFRKCFSPTKALTGDPVLLSCVLIWGLHMTVLIYF